MDEDCWRHGGEDRDCRSHSGGGGIETIEGTLIATFVGERGRRVDDGKEGRGRSGGCHGVNFSRRCMRRKKGRKENNKRKEWKEKERE